MLRPIVKLQAGRWQHKMCLIMYRALVLRQRRLSRVIQSLHTNSLDEALGLPTDYAADRTQHPASFAAESNMAHVIDPFGGSYLVEDLTQKLLIKRANTLLKQNRLAACLRRLRMAYQNCVSKRWQLQHVSRFRCPNDSWVNRYQPKFSGEAEQIEVRRIDNSRYASSRLLN